MEKERRIKGLSIAALLIAVVGLTIAFAAMNRTLNINNTTAKVGKFNVRFVLDDFGGTILNETQINFLLNVSPVE